MLRKQEGSILIFSVIVLSLITLFSATCSALIFSNNKYSKYNYKNIYIEELCLGAIELVYSNAMKEVLIALENNQDFESFKSYFDDEGFIDRVDDVYIENSKIRCIVDCENNRFESEDGIYYRINSEYNDGQFRKNIFAYLKIVNPFEKNQEDLSSENIENTNEGDLEDNQEKEVVVSEEIAEETIEESNNSNNIELNPGDLVQIIKYEVK